MYSIRNTYTKIGTIQRKLAWPLRKSKLGRNLLCPGAKREEERGKGGRERETSKAAPTISWGIIFSVPGRKGKKRGERSKAAPTIRVQMAGLPHRPLFDLERTL